MREKLATHVKRVDRKQRKVKRAPFIACHLLLQAFLHSTHVSLSPNTRSKINRKYKEEEEELT